MTYLDGLNEKQLQAVTTTEGPVSVLAGAGSGKTRVLTTRIYHLIRGGVAPRNILAVTFTNKAAREMRERLSHMLPDSPLPFVATFHGLGREILQTHGSVLGISRYFSVYDRDDSERAVKEALKELSMDPKEVPPRPILSRISKAKGKGYTAEEYKARNAGSSFQGRVTSDVWEKYDARLKKEKALDFDDLIVLPVRLLREHPLILEQVRDRFQYVHVDEFQDTNELQGEFIEFIAGEKQNLFVVGDIDQCLVKGTNVSLADGGTKKIEKIMVGDEVLSNYGTGVLRGAPITHIHSSIVSDVLVRITTESEKTLTSTKEHIHFAGYRLGRTPQMFFTYLMHKKGYGWRVGVSQTYTNGQKLIMTGFVQRNNHEHADELWIVGTHESSVEARIHEYKTSLTYGIPTIPFVARKSKSYGGYVGDQESIDGIFAVLDTDTAGKKLLKDLDLDIRYPHHRAQATKSNRRNIVVTLCGDSRGKNPFHRISVVGSDTESHKLLEQEGFSVRSAKKNSASWRFETGSTDYGRIREIVDTLLKVFPHAQVIELARLGGNKKNPKDGNSLPFTPASNILPGMVMFTEDGGYDVVKTVEKVQGKDVRVYDLNVDRTHNFIANGIVTHNSVYAWRGATIENLLSFEKTYPAAKHIVLEHNYRSTKNIVEASNTVIERNKNRKEKHAITDNPQGNPIELHVLDTAEKEARFVALDARSRLSEGVSATEIAVLYRTNFQSRALEEAFLRYSIPYTLLGTRFLDRKEVKDVLAWIRLALEPTRETDRVRAIQSPSRGIGKVTIAKIAVGHTETLSPAVRAKVQAFEDVVTTLHTESETALPSMFVKRVIEASGIEASLLKDGEEGQERLENARELATLASRYDALPGREGISSFLADTALAGDQDEIDRPERGGKKEGVTLMTVHGSKGLEFEVVYVTGMEEGLFPHQGMGDEEDRDEEEERRLFYVAMTRAKKELILTLARIRRIYGTDFMSEPSSFLADIDASLLYVEYGDGEEVIHI